MKKGYIRLTGAIGVIIFMICLQSSARGLFNLSDIPSTTPTPQPSVEAHGLFDLSDITTASPTPEASATGSSWVQLPEQSSETQAPESTPEESVFHQNEMTDISDGSSLFEALRTPEPTPFPTPCPRAENKESITEGNFVYMQLNDEDASILAYTGKETNVIIPGVIQNLKVRSIEASAFSGNENLQTVEVPEEIETISDWAFSFCENLTEVKICEGLKTIGDYVFAGCPLLTAIHIPGSVETIGKDIFACENSRANLVIWLKMGSYAEQQIKGKKYTISFEQEPKNETSASTAFPSVGFDPSAISGIAAGQQSIAQEPQKCPDCDNGYCKVCHGFGECEECRFQFHGPGTIDCSRCGATGDCGYCSYGYIMTYKYGEGYIDKECGICHGDGKCTSCGGYGYKKCMKCNGTGNCPACDGKRKCLRCNGTGWLTGE